MRGSIFRCFWATGHATEVKQRPTLPCPLPIRSPSDVEHIKAASYDVILSQRKQDTGTLRCDGVITLAMFHNHTSWRCNLPAALIIENPTRAVSNTHGWLAMFRHLKPVNTLPSFRVRILECVNTAEKVSQLTDHPAPTETSAGFSVLDCSSRSPYSESGISWLRIQTVAGFCNHSNENVVSIKGGRNAS
jgi:hypothetical protein